MRYKHAFINASPLAFAEPGESQRSLVSPLHPCRITTGGFKGKRWTGLNGPEGWQLPWVCSAKHRISFPADRVAAGEKETPEFFTDAPGQPGALGKQPEQHQRTASARQDANGAHSGGFAAM